MDTRCRSSGVPDGGPTIADPVGRPGSSGRAVARQIPGRQPSSDEDSGGGPTWVSSGSPPCGAALGSGTQKSWRRPIFPKGCPLSIFGAGELDFRVRDGNGYGLSARVTRILLLDVIGCTVALRVERGAPRSRDRRFRRVARVRFPDPALTLGQVLKWSSPRPLVPLGFVRHRTSTRGLSSRWSTCGLTRLTRWGTSSPGELRT